MLHKIARRKYKTVIFYSNKGTRAAQYLCLQVNRDALGEYNEWIQSRIHSYVFSPLFPPFLFIPFPYTSSPSFLSDFFPFLPAVGRTEKHRVIEKHSSELHYYIK